MGCLKLISSVWTSAGEYRFSASPPYQRKRVDIIEADDRSSSREHKRVSTEPAPSTQKVVKHPRVPMRKRKRHKADANCDDIYNYYAGFGPNRKKKRGAMSWKEVEIRSNVGQKEDLDDDDEKPLKERSMKSLLEPTLTLL
ncbi:hypothetical protein POM88_029993 [Heracleum sosnowskyi]|uniref:Uncharacterized protein n=1 Tax=Heracleum sosnowskyi TaxID=360622 RepID=A0AAD8MFC8_9APIA|nr:hypothetical protein POM88_029993 [Heracleum sosnowskyi]